MTPDTSLSHDWSSAREDEAGTHSHGQQIMGLSRLWYIFMLLPRELSPQHAT